MDEKTHRIMFCAFFWQVCLFSFLIVFFCLFLKLLKETFQCFGSAGIYAKQFMFLTKKLYMKLIAHAKMLSKSTFFLSLFSFTLIFISRLFVSSSISIRIFEYFPLPSLNSNCNKRSNNNNKKESYVYININIHIDIFFPGLFT